MANDLVLSVFTEYDPTNPKFLFPLGPPNPRLVGNGTTERNLIFRMILANLIGVEFSAPGGEFEARIGPKASMTWPKAVTIPAGGSLVIQGLGPGVSGGIAVLDTLGIPNGVVDLQVSFKVGGQVRAFTVMPLRIDGNDIYAAGPEGSFSGLPDTNAAAKTELEVKTKRQEELVVQMKKEQEEIDVLVPRINKLKGLLGAVVLLIAALPLLGADSKGSFYSQGDLSIETFVGTQTGNLKHWEGEYGVGLAYNWHRNWSMGARLLHNGGFDVEGTIIQDVQGRITGRLPLDKHAAMAPYIYVGLGYRVGSLEQPRGRQNFHFDSGVGLEYKFSKQVSAFAEFGPNANFDSHNTFSGAAGIRWTF